MIYSFERKNGITITNAFQNCKPNKKLQTKQNVDR